MRKKIVLLVILICLVALFLRLWRSDELFYFMMDEAYLAFRGWNLFGLKRFFIIGAASPLGFHLPPYFFWFSALFLPISNFDPLAWGVIAALAGVVTVFWLFLLSRKLANSKIGLIASLLYATSWTAILYDRHFWMLVFNPLFTIITLWLLVAKPKFKWFFLSLVLVFGITADPSNLTLLILVLYDWFSKVESLAKKSIFLISFAVLFLGPLIIFDIRHKGSNFAGISRFFASTRQSQISGNNIINALLFPSRELSLFWYNPQLNVSFFHTYCPTYAFSRQVNQPILLQLVAFGLIIIYCFKKLKNPGKEKYLVRLLIIYFLGLFIYGGLIGRPLFDHYLAGLLPIFAYISAKCLFRFWAIGFIFLILFIFLNPFQISRAVNPYGLKSSREAVVWLGKELNGQEFAFDTVSKCFRYNGIRYLLEINNLKPAISFIDPNFFWLYRDKPAQYFPDRMVVFTDKALKSSLPVLKENEFGAWKVFIIDNSKKTYQIEGL